MPFPAIFDLSFLDGANGFQINGETTTGYSGSSVASAGDINGDGFDDLVIGAPNTGSGIIGASYVVFGKGGGFSADLNLANLNGLNGFKIVGETQRRIGDSVSSAGDINGDGFDDLIIGNYIHDSEDAAIAHIVFGKAGGFRPILGISTLDGSNGFQINGIDVGVATGYSVDGAGDVNGDGFADIVIGNKGLRGGPGSGDAYVVFGKASGFTADLNLSTLDGTNGFIFDGENTRDRAGFSVSGAGDVNGDGFDDLVIGANHAYPNGASSGASFVVFGAASGFSSRISANNLDGTNGFQINGETAEDESGFSVAGAGDINSDGFDDLIIGAPYADPNGSRSGASYVVFGKAGGFSANLQLSSLNGTNGFQINGEAINNLSGYSVAAAGDVNNDGFADMIVGAWEADPNGISSGASYVIFGKAGGFLASISLSTLNGSDGFKITGEMARDRSGRSVAGAGDVNGDGSSDLIIGAPGKDAVVNGFGASYVVFGQASNTAPSFSAINVVTSVDEQLLTTAFKVADLAIADDALGAQTFAVSGADAAAFEVVSGALYFKAGTLLDFESGKTSYSVTVSLDDPTVGSSPDDAESFNFTVTNVVFSPQNGGTGNDTLNGQPGIEDDILNGLGGDDFLAGGAGNDTMAGGAGNDTYVVDSSTDVVTEAAASGTDLVLSSVTYTLGANVENLTLTGGASVNGTGNTLVNTLTGNSGNNTLNGGASADTMIGGAGNDTYVVDNAGDVVLELVGEGTDLVSSTVAYSLAGLEVENLTLTGAAAVNGTGNGYANTITGNNSANVLTGDLGNDTLNSAAGNDTLLGGEGNDGLNGGLGADAMAGGVGNDIYYVENALDAITEIAGEGTLDIAVASVTYTIAANVERLQLSGTASISGTGNAQDNEIFGNAGANVLNGAGGADALSAGAGIDTLIGGAGNDTLTGGTEADDFHLDFISVDTVRDFQAGLDKVVVSASASGGVLTAGGPVTLIANANPTASGAGAQLLYDTDDGRLYLDADGSGSGAALHFATFSNLAVLGAADFMVIA